MLQLRLTMLTIQDPVSDFRLVLCFAALSLVSIADRRG